MILLPAIDIQGGRAVRLVQGRFDDATVYADDPLDAARAWARDGARWLHVVDLDAARAGEPVNLGQLRRIVEQVGLPVQFGGGLRNLEACRDALDAGAARIVVGTAAYRDPELLDELVAAHGDRLVVAVDVRGGKVSAAGWTESTELDAVDVVARMTERGIGRFAYTNVDRDGMFAGVDSDEIRSVAETVDAKFIYSGGIGSLDDLRELAGLGLDNLDGVIVGKALFERRFSVAEGQAALAQDA
ncbi:MAG TPA: 1-(5-phosphoribosyl)-5-[(5-phosphoribosylamino)methylideneamino]imidazole-4-carboxamide isomerase [Solirubrobacteraceae bacterium]|nr:1-(5-phosphoribosyl)-5-[(5-phosphoribosylamino)methylideneamino]imidazole-4-carboxamide isomerase [Solirubrobacteraceae bacterium]